MRYSSAAFTRDIHPRLLSRGTHPRLVSHRYSSVYLSPTVFICALVIYDSANSTVFGFGLLICGIRIHPIRTLPRYSAILFRLDPYLLWYSSATSLPRYSSALVSRGIHQRLLSRSTHPTLVSLGTYPRASLPWYSFVYLSPKVFICGTHLRLLSRSTHPTLVSLGTYPCASLPWYSSVYLSPKVFICDTHLRRPSRGTHMCTSFSRYSFAHLSPTVFICVLVICSLKIIHESKAQYEPPVGSTIINIIWPLRLVSALFACFRLVHLYLAQLSGFGCYASKYFSSHGQNFFQATRLLWITFIRTRHQ